MAVKNIRKQMMNVEELLILTEIMCIIHCTVHPSREMLTQTDQKIWPDNCPDLARQKN